MKAKFGGFSVVSQADFFEVHLGRELIHRQRRNRPLDRHELTRWQCGMDFKAAMARFYMPDDIVFLDGKMYTTNGNVITEWELVPVYEPTRRLMVEKVTMDEIKKFSKNIKGKSK